MTPNAEQIKSIIRAALVLVFGGTLGIWLAKRGFVIDDNFITMLTGLLFGGFSLVWSMFRHTEAAQVQKAAEVVPIPTGTQIAAGVAPAAVAYPSDAKIQPGS